MLSKDNYDILNENFLYKKEPTRDPNEIYIGCVPSTYWCKNWTFRVKKHDGKAFMYDTYWTSQEDYTEVTDENFPEFKFVFDFRDVQKITFEEHNEYDEKDLTYAIIGSGGITSRDHYWIKKGTRKSKSKQIEKTQENIRSLKYKLGRAERELEELLEA